MYEKGRQVLKWYDDLEVKPKDLMDKEWATKITHSIMQWAMDYRKKFASSDLKYLSKQIVVLFPCEDEVWFLYLLFNIVFT